VFGSVKLCLIPPYVITCQFNAGFGHLVLKPVHLIEGHQLIIATGLYQNLSLHLTRLCRSFGM
jgi:hypothetical protein